MNREIELFIGSYRPWVQKAIRSHSVLFWAFFALAAPVTFVVYLFLSLVVALYEFLRDFSLEMKDLVHLHRRHRKELRKTKVRKNGEVE